MFKKNKNYDVTMLPSSGMSRMQNVKHRFLFIVNINIPNTTFLRLSKVSVPNMEDNEVG